MTCIENSTYHLDGNETCAQAALINMDASSTPCERAQESIKLVNQEGSSSNNKQRSVVQRGTADLMTEVAAHHGAVRVHHHVPPRVTQVILRTSYTRFTPAPSVWQRRGAKAIENEMGCTDLLHVPSGVRPQLPRSGSSTTRVSRTK